MNTEQERAKLLPCPFCGGTNIEIQISTPDREGVPTNLTCSDCGASGPWEYEQGNSHTKADDAWNRRAAPQSQTMPYAGVTVWVGEKRCSHGVTKDELELYTFDLLQAAFDHARRAIVRAAAEKGDHAMTTNKLEMTM